MKDKRFIIEVTLYGTILAVALIVRLSRLGLAPLSPGEAGLALAAWDGTPPPAGTSPLLYWLDSVLFAIFGGGDGLARLVPALAGSALVALPILWRERIGRAGALGAAALLAISPTAIIASRTLSGDAAVVSIMLGLVAVTGLYWQTGRSLWLYAAAVLLGLGLAGGHTLYSALLALLVATAFATWGNTAALRDRWSAIRSQPGLLGRWTLVLAMVLIAGATGFLWRPSGLGTAADLFSAWLSGFGSAPLGQSPLTSPAWPWQVLAVYEFLVVILGFTGLFWAVQRDAPSAVFLIVWLAVALLLVAVRPGRTAGDILLVIVPLALLGGYALEALAQTLPAGHLSAEETVVVAVMLPVIAFLVLSVAAYANNPTANVLSSQALALGPFAALIPLFLAAAIGIIVLMLAAAVSTTEIALHGGTIAILATLVMATWAAGWGAAQNHPGDPRELLWGPETTAPAVRDLVRDVAKLSADTTTDPTTLAFAVQSPPSNSVLGWYLRDMRNAHFVSALDAESIPAVFITTDPQPPSLPNAGSYAGERFTVQQEWRLSGGPAADVVKWFLYRRAESPKPTQQATLWVRQGQ